MPGSSRIRNAFFSAATVLALGFGAAQAFAAPSAPQRDGAALACAQPYCYNSCRSSGYLGGFCEEFNGSTYCECYGYGPIIINPDAE